MTRLLLMLGCCVLVGLSWARAIEAAPFVKAPRVVACDRQHPGECHRAIAYWRRQARTAAAAVVWQRAQRWRVQALEVRQVTLDAIRWAAEKYTSTPPAAAALAGQMTGIGSCESHLWPFATNGRFKGWGQLGGHHLADPIFLRVPWQDAYAQADHMARYLIEHGAGEWQCKSTGGLRW